MKDWICDFLRLFDTEMNCIWKNIIVGLVVLTMLMIVAYFVANA